MDDQNNSSQLHDIPHDIPEQPMPADIDMQNYKDNALHKAHSGATPSEILNIPEEEVKIGLDQIAFDESMRGTDGAENTAETDDWREHVEDMDENDKS